MKKLVTRTLLLNVGIILGVALLIGFMIFHYWQYGFHYVIGQNCI